ncbi:hypothetical protein LUZ60_005312 [Juncus effusus]|nr:hypothetical protein LUZ60_005312 [Juncus effusus]
MASPLLARSILISPKFSSTICCSGNPPKPKNGGPTKAFKKKRTYGASRRSIRKSFTQEQVVFNTPKSENPVVGIIGGGVSGLVCAAELEERGIRSVVFDTGLHGLGGRMATREIQPRDLVFDHAAQFFTCKDERFQKFVDKWVEKGLICEWKGLIGELESGGNFTPLMDEIPRYVGVNGMRHLADSILNQSENLEIVRPCWISKIEPLNGLWYLSEKDKLHGTFDAVVIAHNGKCANRLLSTSGLPILTRQMKKLDISAIYALLAAFENPLPIPQNSEFEGAFVKNVESLSWMGNNTKKIFPSETTKPHCWTFFSTAAYGKRNKVPQENIPNITVEKVKREMLEGVELALGLNKGSLESPFYTRVQLWGAALPTNTPGVPCIFDPQGRAGICGDWLLGSSVESAALSGISLANHMADYFESDESDSDKFAIGLSDSFSEVESHDIGQFPGMNLQKVNEAQMALTC